MRFSPVNEEIPLKDFFRNPEKTAYQISPDGVYLSFLASYENRLNIFVQEIGKEELTRITSVTERDIAGYFWKNNNRIVYLRDNKGDERAGEEQSSIGKASLYDGRRREPHAFCG